MSSDIILPQIMGKFGIFTFLTFGILLVSTNADLQMNFYAKSCPRAEKIVLDFVNEHIPNAPPLAAALIRMHFHDCFVRVSVYVQFCRCYIW